MDNISTSSRREIRPSRIRGYRPVTVITAALFALASIGVVAGGHADTAHKPRYGALDDIHLKHLIHHVMTRVDEPQQEQMKQIAHAAHEDLQALEQRAQAARAPRAQILLADVVDRDALESVRVAEMRIADERSRRVDRLLVDVAVVLTPQQRAQLHAEMAD